MSSLSRVSEFLSELTSDRPLSEISRLSRRDQCSVLPRYLQEVTPQESVSQISLEEDASIPSDEISLISRAKKDELQWKAKRLDALTQELRAIQIGSKPGLSTATLRDLLGAEAQLVETKTVATATDSVGMGMSLLSLATSTAIPALLTLTLVTISLHASSTSPFPPLRHLHNLITSTSASQTASPATIIYRSAKPMTGISPHNLTFLVPFLVVGSAVVGWNILCTELGVEFRGIFGKTGIVGKILGDVEEGWEIDWDGVRDGVMEFFGMVEGV